MNPNPPDHHSEAEPPSSASSPPPVRPPLVRFYCRRERKISGNLIPADPVPTQEDSDHSFQKKTRDLPNLTECHACGFRVDVCNGKNRLQTLYSEWRIVLLCRKCLLLVESSRICSYCFGEASKGCLCCGDCKRSVHERCFDEYRSIAPWSYSCSGSLFSVCVDCWVPKSMASSRRVSKIRRLREKLESNWVSDNESDGNLEGLGKDVKCIVERKVVIALRARGAAVKKAAVEKKAEDLARSASDLVAKKDGDGDKVVDDAELAIQLHRAMNSLPRIAKNLRSVNLSRLGVPRILKHIGDSSARGSDDSESPSVCGKLEAFTNNKLYENPDKSVSETSVCAKALDGVVNAIVSARDDGPSPEECSARDENGNADVPLKEGEGSCSNKLVNSFGDDNIMDSDSPPDQNQDKSTSANAGDCIEMPDRYLIKYSKKRANLNTISGSKRKFLYEGFQLESQASAAGVLLNCSKESTTFSNSSFQSGAAPFQTPVCGSGSAREQS